MEKHETYLGIQIFRFYFKCTKCSSELTIKTDPQNSNYVVELGASRNFEPWRAKDEEADKENQKRETEEMGDAMKSLENRTLDSKREMDILAALDEVKSMRSRQATIRVDAMLEILRHSAEEKEKKLEEEDEALIKSLFGAPREVVCRIDDDILDDDEDLFQISTDNTETSNNNSKRRKISEELPTNRFLKNFPLSQQII
ncbi:splicing factor YJU2-like isoform X2 [Camellia sinensis]|uniref:splicing factor YJU2-like isoform X2 n=1 Tax=Camellia sinensis TaxID=4442 RepID=UPI001035E2A4|nr:splicing factor YJU2-like isoform X2 [Camellia sinensis]